MVRHVPTGRTPSEIRVEFDVTVCADCGRPLVAPNVNILWQQCSSCPHVENGHHVLVCRACRTANYDPPCTREHAGHGSAYG